MSRRSSLPGADELFRTTGPGLARESRAEPSGSPAGQQGPGPAPLAPVAPSAPAHQDDDAVAPVDDLAPLTAAVASFDVPGEEAERADAAGTSEPMRSAVVPVRHTSAVRRRPRAVGERRPSGRERHEEKITVYVSAEELMDLEHARLNLRGDHGLAVDRGRIVREALAVVLADLEAKGEASILVRRLTGR
jgi:hypothetical protein